MSEVEPEVSEKELTELLKKVDKESAFRNLTGYRYRIVFWVAVAFSCFQFYTATFICLFVLFGSFLEKTGIGRLFIDMANAIAGWASDGPPKVAVVTSALEGTTSRGTRWRTPWAQGMLPSP